MKLEVFYISTDRYFTISVDDEFGDPQHIKVFPAAKHSIDDDCTKVVKYSSYFQVCVERNDLFGKVEKLAKIIEIQKEALKTCQLLDVQDDRYRGFLASAISESETLMKEME